MRDRPRVRVRLVIDDEGFTEASVRAMERIEGLPDGTVVETLQVFPAEDAGGRGGDEKAKPQPSEMPAVYAVWNRRVCTAFSLGPDSRVYPVSPSGLSYPSEDGGMSFGLPSNDAMSVLVEADSGDSSWAEDEAIASLPDGSVVEVRWLDGGAVVNGSFGLMYGREFALLPEAGEGGMNQ